MILSNVIFGNTGYQVKLNIFLLFIDDLDRRNEIRIINNQYRYTSDDKLFLFLFFLPNSFSSILLKILLWLFLVSQKIIYLLKKKEVTTKRNNIEEQMIEIMSRTVKRISKFHFVFFFLN